MEWLSRYPWVVTIVVVTVLGVIIRSAGRYAARGSAPAPTTASITVAVALAFGVGFLLSTVWAYKRDRDTRAWSARQQHFERLRPVIQKDSEQFRTVVERFRTEGTFVHPTAEDPAIAQMYELTWRPQHPLTPDIVNHFPEYGRGRDALQATVRAHESAIRELFIQIRPALTGLDEHPDSFRNDVAVAALKRCMGMTVQVKVQNHDQGYSFVLDHTAGSSSAGTAPPEYLASARAFESFKASPRVVTACRKLASDARSIITEATELSSQALELLEHATLTGTCPFLQGE